MEFRKVINMMRILIDFKKKLLLHQANSIQFTLTLKHFKLLTTLSTFTSTLSINSNSNTNTMQPTYTNSTLSSTFSGETSYTLSATNLKGTQAPQSKSSKFSSKMKSLFTIPPGEEQTMEGRMYRQSGNTYMTRAM